MASSNWSAHDPVKNYAGQQDRAQQRQQAQKQVTAAQAAGPGKRRI